MKASERRAIRSADISNFTTAEDPIRALTEAPRIKPTSTRCRSAWQPNPAEAPLIDAEILFRQPGPAQKGLPALRANAVFQDGNPIQCIDRHAKKAVHFTRQIVGLWRANRLLRPR